MHGRCTNVRRYMWKTLGVRRTCMFTKMPHWTLWNGGYPYNTKFGVKYSQEVYIYLDFSIAGIKLQIDDWGKKKEIARSKRTMNGVVNDSIILFCSVVKYLWRLVGVVQEKRSCPVTRNTCATPSVQKWKIVEDINVNGKYVKLQIFLLKSCLRFCVKSKYI